MIFSFNQFVFYSCLPLSKAINNGITVTINYCLKSIIKEINTFYYYFGIVSYALFGLRWGFEGRRGRGLEGMCEVVWIEG